MLKKVKESEEVQQISLKMSDINATVQQIGQAGISLRLFVIIYGGKETDSLNKLRFLRFMEMIASQTLLNSQKLPPTERAAYYHSLQVHLQVMMWMKLSIDVLDPRQRGWKLSGSIFTLIKTDLEAAPENLLTFVRCKCKLSLKNPCGTNLC